MTGEAGAALAAGRDGAHEHAISNVVSRNTIAELFDYAHRFVSDNQAGCNRVFAPHNVQVRSTDRRQRHANNCFTSSSTWFVYLFDPYFVLTSKNVCFHFNLPFTAAPHANDSM